MRTVTKIIIASTQETLINVSELLIGEFGIIRDIESTYNGHIVLRCYTGLISLTNPASTWTYDDISLIPAFKVALIYEININYSTSTIVP